jgi:hypothetical protein
MNGRANRRGQDKSRKVRLVDMPAISTTRKTLRISAQLVKTENALFVLSFRHLADRRRQGKSTDRRSGA